MPRRRPRPASAEDQRERDRLILEGLSLAHRVARLLARNVGARDAKADDIRSAALEGLVAAATDFDPSNGAGFAAYARRRITGAVLDFLRGQDHVSRHYRIRSKAGTYEAPPSPISLDWLIDEAGDRFADPRAVDPLAAAERAEFWRDVEARMARIPKRLRTVLEMRYGQDEKLGAIGAALGVTESRALQLLRLAHGKYLALAQRDYDIS